MGPVWPFRGGIAQYTTRLHEALFPLAKVTTLSFRRLYPSWLYPGESDREPGAHANGNPTTDQIYFTLDYANPMTWARGAKQLLAARCRVVVINWWTLFWAVPSMLIAHRLRRHGIRVVLLCHNLADHDGSGFKRRLSEHLLRQADAYLVHSTAMREQLHRIAPGRPVLTRLHPIYDHYPRAVDTLLKRGRLELLFFGFIRPYKGLDDLIAALEKLDDDQVYLTIVGEPWGTQRALTDTIAARNVKNIELVLRYVEPTEAANYFTRADLVVLPYRTATGSGVASLASHYGLPILATRVGGLAEYVVDGRTGFLIPANDVDAMATMIGHLQREKLRAMDEDIRQFCTENSWDSFAHHLLEFAADL